MITDPPSEDSLKGGATAPAFQLKKILVPIDFSECSKKALQYAIPFARQFGAELILLHLVQQYPEVTDEIPMALAPVEDIQTDLEALRKMVGDTVPSQALVQLGDPRVEITKAAKELSADLIILSTHGRTGLERVLLGSTAEKVVRHAGCPVLVVRELEHEFIAETPRDKPVTA
jgi:nucleotide-binding universal stress UspA family protein